MDRARLIFFASWLVGDFLHLFGTVFSGHAQTTQIALYMCARLSPSLSLRTSLLLTSKTPERPQHCRLDRVVRFSRA